MLLTLFWMNSLKIGCKPLDSLLGEGIEKGIISKIYGESGTGKTNICLQAARECAKSGLKVAYVDTEGVSIERLHQICKSHDFKKIFNNILFFKPKSLDEQRKIILDVTKKDDIRLVIIDTINMFYRINLEDDKEGTMRSFTKQVSNLQIATREKDLFVIIAEQVYTDKNGEIKPFTNRDTEHMIKTVIKLEKKDVGQRRAIIIKHRSQPEENKTCFKITEKGLE